MIGWCANSARLNTADGAQRLGLPRVLYTTEKEPFKEWKEEKSYKIKQLKFKKYSIFRILYHLASLTILHTVFNTRLTHPPYSYYYWNTECVWKAQLTWYGLDFTMEITLPPPPPPVFVCNIYITVYFVFFFFSALRQIEFDIYTRSNKTDAVKVYS